MAKKLLLITVLVLASTIISLEIVDCDYLLWECPGTCCVDGNSFYYCFRNLPNGVCCSEGDFACPNGTSCNVNQRACDYDQSSFLESEKSLSEVRTFPDLKLNQALELLEGLVSGLELTKIQEHSSICIQKASNPELFQDITKIITLVKSLNIKKDFVHTIEEIYDEVLSVYAIIEDEIAPCTDYVKELEKTPKELLEHLKRDGHWANAMEHVIFNFKNLESIIESLEGNIKDKNYKNIGINIGEIIKFLFYWDFKVGA